MDFGGDIFDTIISELLGLEGGFSDEGMGIAPASLEPGAQRPVESRPAGFAVIRQDDAEFDVESFYARVEEMFHELHRAMDARNLDPVRHVLSPSAYASVRDRLLASASAALIGPLDVERCNALAVKRDGGRDHVFMRIIARPASGGDLVQEYWGLVRDVGARSKAGASLFKCPNCGGPIDGADRVHCSYCGVQLCDPALDWVVERIGVE